MSGFRSQRGLGVAVLMSGLWLCTAQQSDAPHDATEQRELFEARIRPLLAAHCYDCHSTAGESKGGVTLDTREGIRAQTSAGRIVTPGQPEESRLLSLVRHEVPGLEMPAAGARLDDTAIADLERWIRHGAFDPRDTPPSAEELAATSSWPALLERRREWWSLQPLPRLAPALPAPTAWSDHPVDRYIERALTARGLTPGPAADRRTLIRRLSFAVTGLPPSLDEIDTYLADDATDATERLIERLLASPHFGERWARHWMDVVRYADSHGSEGDPTIPHAYRYRDYLIRAFNADVPFDQLAREHIAGDLLADPRLDSSGTINESAIGTAHWRMVFHGFAPTDALDEKVRFIDDQINVLGKAFLAQTISCARCHDHKFDAISQADYYALFGVLASCRPAMLDVNAPSRMAHGLDELTAHKRQIHIELAKAWSLDAEVLQARVQALVDELYAGTKESAGEGGVLAPLVELRNRTAEGSSFEDAWNALVAAWQVRERAWLEESRRPSIARWRLGSDEDYGDWFQRGGGANEPAKGGAFTLALAGERLVESIYPDGAYTHLHSTRQRGVLESPRFTIAGPTEAWLLTTGGGQARARYVVQDYPRGGTVYPIQDIRGPGWSWQRFDLSYWDGESAHLELVTARDAPVEVRDQEHSWFGAREVVLLERGSVAPQPRTGEAQEELFAFASRQQPANHEEVAQSLARALLVAVEAWRDERATTAQALLLDACVQEGVLPNTAEALPAVAELVAAYRERERALPMPTRVPGLSESTPIDQPLFERGDHRRPTTTIARRFLEIVDDTPYPDDHSGRLQLAEDLLREDNPLTARVISNRLWHWTFGSGLVTTPDDFGRMGAEPTHPELLDYLALRLIDRDWSIKEALRFLLTSKTWQLASRASPAALAIDPANRLRSHADVRRLEAEALRDTLLAISGRLDRTLYGTTVAANGSSVRRGIYVAARRNSLDDFLTAFDAPVPFATTGRRASTNVPAQSLALLNDPFVLQLARDWGAQIAADSTLRTDRERSAAMFERALGREPEVVELEALVEYATRCRAELAQRDARIAAVAAEQARAQAALDDLLEPTRQRLQAAAGLDPQGPQGLAGSPAPEPLALWNFREGLEDVLGELHARPHGSARQQGGALVLDGSGHASTPALPIGLGPKTLEAWVQLETLDQSGGGLMSVQNQEGDVFDAIVFAERRPRRWMAGSDFFKRTRDFDGSDEAGAAEDAVHVAITYDVDGTIRGYREGLPYGTPYRSDGLVTHAPNSAHVLFGLRHGSPAPGRMLRGRVLEARLYDRALSDAEVLSSYSGAGLVRRIDVLEALTPAARARAAELERSLESISRELDELENAGGEDALTRVAHALFNLKELLYVR